MRTTEHISGPAGDRGNSKLGPDGQLSLPIGNDLRRLHSPIHSLLRSSRITHAVALSLAFLSLALIASACGSQSVKASSPSSAPASSSSLEPNMPTLGTVKFSTGSRSAQYMGLYVAIDKGFFKRAGVTVDYFSSSTPTGTLLASGAANFSSGQPIVTYDGQAAGIDTVAVYSPAPTVEFFVSKPSVTSPTQLGGSKIGVFNLQDLDVLWARRLTAKFNIPSSDYTLVASGLTPAKLAAVSAGAVTAAPVYPPTNFQAISQGLKVLYSTVDLPPAVPTYYVSLGSWATSHRETVVAVLRALNGATEWLFDPSNKDEAIKLIEKWTSANQQIAAQSYDLYFGGSKPIASRNGEWDADAVKALGPELVKYGLLKRSVDYAKTVAPQYVAEAVAEGPIK